MEPMAVSPGKSPSSSSQYLPSFLMGEAPSPGIQASSPLPTANYSRSSWSKVEGPPIVGLFDELSSSPPHNSSNYFPPSTSISHNTSLETSCVENQENQSYWVRVQGFDPAQLTRIIAFFSQLGRVLEHNYPANTNWIFFRYANQADMRKALRMDLKILWGQTMIGVVEMKPQSQAKSNPCLCCNKLPCVDDIPSYNHSSPKSYPPSPLSSNSISPIPCCQVGTEGVSNSHNSSTLGHMSITSPTSPKMRPLAISKSLNAQTPTGGDRGSAGVVPSADTSLVGKFIDFVFSW